MPNHLPSVTSLGPYGTAFAPDRFGPYGLYGRGPGSATAIEAGTDLCTAAPMPPRTTFPLLTPPTDMTAEAADRMCTPGLRRADAARCGRYAAAKVRRCPDDEEKQCCLQPRRDREAASLSHVDPTVLVFRDGHQ